MPTVNFHCVQCGSLIGVSSDFLGRQVRCPHCKQVVTAPATAPVPVTVLPPPFPLTSEAHDFPLFNSPLNPEEQDSIFGEIPVDDLFGAPQKTGLQLPPAPLPSQPLPAAPVFPPPLPSVQPPAAHGSPATAPTYMDSSPGPMFSPTPPQEAAAAQDGEAASGAPVDAAASPPAGMDWLGGPSIDPATGLADEPAPAPDVPRPAVYRVSGGTQLAPWILIFLIPYAILMTAVAITYYAKWSMREDPMERLPDFPSDQPGAKKGGSVTFQRHPPDAELPDKLRVGLGQSIRVGDLEVVPEKVEQRRVTYCYRLRRLDSIAADTESLVLHLRLKNVSSNLSFRPTDPAFEKRWRKGDPDSAKPYTFLEAGSQRFYGGPFLWKPRGSRGDDPMDEYIEGQKDNTKDLKPGEELQTVMCTAEEDDVPEVLRKYKGKLLWRVHLRRGLVWAGDRETSATAVIGVEFSTSDIRK